VSQPLIPSSFNISRLCAIPAERLDEELRLP
jgi:hypothetical protein